jgi:hypothetical protein
VMVAIFAVLLCPNLTRCSEAFAGAVATGKTMFGWFPRCAPGRQCCQRRLGGSKTQGSGGKRINKAVYKGRFSLGKRLKEPARRLQCNVCAPWFSFSPVSSCSSCTSEKFAFPLLLHMASS